MNKKEEQKNEQRKKRDIVKKIIKRRIKKPKQKGNFWRYFKIAFFLCVILGFLSAGAFFVWISSLKIPSVDTVRSIKISQATKIYDKTGENLLYSVYGDEKRTIVDINQISKYAVYGAVAVEDKDFFTHQGFKPSSFLMSVYENIKAGKIVRGGSTITQQVVKNVLLTNEKKIERKIKEIILAYKLEKIMTKDQILELYLNENPYGGTIYGIEEASLFYFDEHAKDLSIAQAAYLSAMPQAPTTYSPYGKHKAALDERKNKILRLMNEQGYITDGEYKDALKEEVKFVFKTNKSGIQAPHFVMYVLNELENMYGKDALQTDGMKVITSLDYKLQKEIQENVYEGALQAEKEYGAENAAAVALETETGNILAMIGSRDYFDEDIDGKVNITTSKRQPGSSFKPIVYLSAFQKGYTPETVIWDVETEFSARCNMDLTTQEARESGKCYRPRNFDNKFKGPMKMMNALPESRNIPAVKTLYLVGLEDAIANAKLFGIKSLNKSSDHYGLNLVLGGGEVQLLNLTSAYGTFANEGIRVEPRSILEVYDHEDKEIYKSTVENKRVIDSKYVQNLNQILSNNDLKKPTFGYYSDLYFTNRDVASKTGTTNDNKDSWTVGYDAGHVAVGVWVGNNDNTSANRNPGKVTYKIWRSSMEDALELYPNEDFPEAPKLYSSNTKPSLRGISSGGQTILIDIKTGTLATDDTPEEFIKEIIIPDYHSILHWVDVKNPTGPIPEKKSDLYENWEFGVQQWVIQNSQEVQNQIAQILSDLQGIISANPEGLTEDVVPVNSESVKFKIKNPDDGDEYSRNQKVVLEFRDYGKNEIDKYYIYFNGNLVGSSNDPTYEFLISDQNEIREESVIRVTGESGEGGSYTRSVEIEVTD